jgi:hypothetical protein
MSALPLRADKRVRSRLVRFVPKAEQVALLLDHFVASRKIAASSVLLMHRMHLVYWKAALIGGQISL